MRVEKRLIIVFTPFAPIQMSFFGYNMFDFVLQRFGYCSMKCFQIRKQNRSFCLQKRKDFRFFVTSNEKLCVELHGTQNNVLYIVKRSQIKTKSKIFGYPKELLSLDFKYPR